MKAFYSVFPISCGSTLIQKAYFPRTAYVFVGAELTVVDSVAKHGFTHTLITAATTSVTVGTFSFL